MLSAVGTSDTLYVPHPIICHPILNSPVIAPAVLRLFSLIFPPQSAETSHYSFHQCHVFHAWKGLACSW